MPRRPGGRPRRGFTLIELLVVVGLIALIVGLILPAVQGAREAARRLQCANNLRQLALALARYEGVHASYPCAFLYQRYPATYAADHHSFLVALLPHLEQGPLYDAWNAGLGMFCDQNATIAGSGVALLWCPSDTGLKGAGFTFAPQAIGLPGGVQSLPYPMRYTSYAGSMGMWTGTVIGDCEPSGCVSGTADPQRAAAMAQHNGLIVTNGYGSFVPASSRPPVRVADVTDGLSQTVAIGEKAHGLLSKDDYPAGSSPPGSFYDWHWWVSGNYGDTAITQFYPVNPQKAAGRFGPVGRGDAILHAASSFHPGGVHVALADGSARFLRDSIDSWTLDPDGRPAGASRSGPVWRLAPGAKVGVWQALGSRNGGEVIDGAAY